MLFMSAMLLLVLASLLFIFKYHYFEKDEEAPLVATSNNLTCKNYEHCL